MESANTWELAAGHKILMSQSQDVKTLKTSCIMHTHTHTHTHTHIQNLFIISINQKSVLLHKISEIQKKINWIE